MALSDDQETKEYLRELAESARYAREGVQHFGESMTELEKAKAEAAKITQQTNARLEAAANQAIRSFAGFSKSLTSGAEGGFDKFSDSLMSAAGAVSMVTKNFGIYGQVVGSLIQVTTKLITMQLKQADNALNASDAIKKLGNAGVLSTQEVMKQINASGLSVAQSKIYTEAMKKAGQGVIGLGTQFGEGAKAFGEMVAVTDTQREQMQRLGISQEELMGYQGEYLALQRASGIEMSRAAKDGKALREASLQYTRNLVELSNISGNDIETTKKKLEQEKTRYEYVLSNAMQQQELDRAERAGNYERVAQIKKEMEARDKLVESTSQYLTDSQKQGLAMYLTTGAYTEASKKFAIMGVDMEGFRQRMKNGDDVSAEFAEAIKKATMNSVDSYGTAALFNEQLRESVGLEKEAITNAVARKNLNEKEIADKARKAAEDLASGKKEDPAETARNKLTTATINLTVAFDELLGKINPITQGLTPWTAAFGGVTIAVGAMAAKMAWFSKDALWDKLAGFSKNFGGVTKLPTPPIVPPGGTPAATGAPIKGADGKWRDAAGRFTRAPAGAAAEVAAEATTKAGTAAAEAAAKAGTSAATTGAGAATVAAGEAGLKAAGATAGKALLKSLPVIGSLLSAYSAFDKIKKGDYIGAAMEGGAAVAALVPGPGTAIALGLTSASGARDVYNALNPELDKVSSKTPPSTASAAAPAAATPSFSTPGAAHAGAAGYKPAQGGSGRGGQGGMGFASEAKSIEEAKAIGAATPSAPVASLPGPASTPARASLDIPTDTKKDKAKSGLGDLTGRAKEFVEAAMALGITNPIALKALVMTSAKESNLDPNRKEAGAGAYLKTLANRGIGYIHSVFPQLKGKSVAADGTTIPAGRVAKQLGMEDTGVTADYLKSVWSKGDEAFFDMVYGGLDTNKEAGDGYKYRGRGLVQITGREVYKNVGKIIGKDLEKDPDLVSTDFKTASQAAVGYIFATRGKETALKDLNSMKDQDSALKYVLNTVAGLGHKEKEFSNPKSHLGMQLEKAQKYAALGDKVISAARGGVVDGPTSGYPATLHGNEIITPLSPNSILEQLGKTSVSSSSVSSSSTTDTIKEIYSMNNGIMDMISVKLDTVIEKLTNSNDTQSKLLMYSRV